MLLLTLTTLLACAGEANVTLNDRIATIGNKDITYADVLLGKASALESLQSGDERVLRGARKFFDDIALERLLEHAAQAEGITVREEDLRKLAPPLFDDAELSRRYEWSVAIPRAALLVIRGADKRAVYNEHLARYEESGITREAFDAYLKLFRDEERTTEFLQRETKEHYRQKLLLRARQSVIRSALRALLTERARTTSTTFEAARQRFWAELLQQTEARVFDSRFELPTAEKGLP
jgi:hypothetical protein